MTMTVSCPTCGARLKAPEDSAGKTVKCPKCGAGMVIPAAAPPPPPVVTARPRPAPEPEDDQDDEPPRPSRRRSSRRRVTEEYEEDYDNRPVRRADESGTDAPGVLGLVFGVVAVLCLLLGCFTCGMTYFAAAPLAAVGAGCSAFGRGNMQVAGLALNILTLIPAIVLFGMMLFGAGAGAITLPPPQR